MRNESFYIIVDNDTLEYQQFTGESTTDLWEAVRFQDYEEALKYLTEILDEDFRYHATIYKVKMHYHLEREGM